MSKKMSAGRGKAGRLSLGVAVALVASAGMAVAADAPRTKRKMMPPPPVVEAPAETKLVDFAFGLRVERTPFASPKRKIRGGAVKASPMKRRKATCNTRTGRAPASVKNGMTLVNGVCAGVRIA